MIENRDNVAKKALANAFEAGKIGVFGKMRALSKIGALTKPKILARLAFVACFCMPLALRAEGVESAIDSASSQEGVEFTESASESAPSAESDSFITPQEYGASLYENPRGIGCVKCHGKDGEETLLASYIHKGKQKHVIIPRINNLDFQAFKKALSIDKGIMPKYGLTDEEINAIFLYITSRNKTFR